MRFPKLNVRSQSREFIQEFGGLDRRPRISENCFSEMRNLTSDFYPALAPRPKRGIVGSIENCNALLAGEKLAWVSGNTLYWGGEAVLELTAGESVPRQLVMMGACIVVFPDNLYYNTVDPDDEGVFGMTMNSADDEFTFSTYLREDATDLVQPASSVLSSAAAAEKQLAGARHDFECYYDGTFERTEKVYEYISTHTYFPSTEGTDAKQAIVILTGIPNPTFLYTTKEGVVVRPFSGYEVFLSVESEGGTDAYIEFTYGTAYPRLYVTGTLWGKITVTNKETGVTVVHNIDPTDSRVEVISDPDPDFSGYWSWNGYIYSGEPEESDPVDTVLCVESPWFSKVPYPSGFETEATISVTRGAEWPIAYLEGLPAEKTRVRFENGRMWVLGALFGATTFTTSSYRSTDKNYTVELKIAESCVPVMDYVIESQNRLWGCRYGLNSNGEPVNEIYASALGDFRQWYTFARVSTDSYVAPVGHPGAFTGAINYRGYPLFFKENVMYKIYGDYPENYQIVTDTGMGVQKGCDKSLFVLSNVLYYKSPDGVFAYDGSSCQRIDDVLGSEHYSNAVCGGVGTKLWLSMEGEQEGHGGLYVCDMDKGMWHKEDATAARFMARYGNDLYVLDSTGRFFTVKGSAGEIESGEISFVAETGVIGYSTPDSKYVSRFALRVSIPHDGSLQIFVEYDSANVWEFKGSIEGVGMQTFTVPVVPRRCDHFRIRLQGKGDCRIFGFSKVLEEGGAV